MADRFSETSQTSYFSRLASSFRGMLVGLMLFAGSVLLLWFNEGRAVRTAKGLAEGSAAVISVKASSIDPANENKLIHISGPVTVAKPLVDPEFTLSRTALKLVRKVEMYQWKEKTETTSREKLGGGQETVTTYTYDRVWSHEKIASSSFKHPEGHANPEGWRVDSQTWLANDAKLEAFDMPIRLVERMGEGGPVALAEGGFKYTGTPAPRLHQQQLCFGADPGAPQVGDMRVSYTMVAPADFSIIAQQSVTSVIPYRTKAGTDLDMISPGRVDAKAMFDRAVQENTFLTWLLRFIGWLLMFFSFQMLFSPLAALVRFVPFLANIVGAGVAIFAAVLASLVSLVIVGLAWMYYRPLLAIGLIVAGAAIVLYFGSKYKRTAVGVGSPSP